MIPALAPVAPRPFLQAKNIYLLLIVLVVLADGVFGFIKGRELLLKRQVSRENETRVEELQKAATELQKSYDDVETKAQTDRLAFAKTAFRILPQGEQYLELTKMLDDFFEKNFQTGNEIVASNLRFSAGSSVPNKPYAALLFSLTITATSEKFGKFLKFVENSGSFDPTENAAQRLLHLQSIKVSFGGNEQKDEISFTVDLRTFYRHTDGRTQQTSTT